MANVKILEFIPKEVHKDLIDEVTDLLKSKGYRIQPPDDEKPTEQTNKDIEEWAKSKTESKK